jgi:hypothetical protein
MATDSRTMPDGHFRVIGMSTASHMYIIAVLCAKVHRRLGERFIALQQENVRTQLGPPASIGLVIRFERSVPEPLESWPIQMLTRNTLRT